MNTDDPRLRPATALSTLRLCLFAPLSKNQDQPVGCNETSFSERSLGKSVYCFDKSLCDIWAIP